MVAQVLRNVPIRCKRCRACSLTSWPHAQPTHLSAGSPSLHPSYRGRCLWRRIVWRGASSSTERVALHRCVRDRLRASSFSRSWNGTPERVGGEVPKRSISVLVEAQALLNTDKAYRVWSSCRNLRSGCGSMGSPREWCTKLALFTTLS